MVVVVVAVNDCRLRCRGKIEYSVVRTDVKTVVAATDRETFEPVSSNGFSFLVIVNSRTSLSLYYLASQPASRASGSDAKRARQWCGHSRSFSKLRQPLVINERSPDDAPPYTPPVSSLTLDTL